MKIRNFWSKTYYICCKTATEVWWDRRGLYYGEERKNIFMEQCKFNSLIRKKNITYIQWSSNAGTMELIKNFKTNQYNIIKIYLSINKFITIKDVFDWRYKSLEFLFNC